MTRVSSLLIRWMGQAVLCIGMATCCLPWAAAQPRPNAVAPMELRGADEIIALPHVRQALVPRGSLTIQDVVSGKLNGTFAPGTGQVIGLSPVNELWIHLPLRNARMESAVWQLQFELPAVDEVTLFEQQGSSWRASSAGDRVANSEWPRNGRYPRFGLLLQPGESRQLYLRIRNAYTVPPALRLLTDTAAEAAEQREYLGFGLALGAVLLVVVACLSQAGVYRNAAYAWYAGYALVMALTLAAVTGLAGQYLWGGFAQWADSSKGSLALAAAGASVLFVRTLCKLPTRHRTLSLVSAAAGILVLVIAVIFAFRASGEAVLLILGMSTAAVMVIVMAAFTWRRGDQVGAWVLAAHGPLVLISLLILLRMVGVSPVAFNANVLASVGLAATLPLLLVALNLRSHEMLSSTMRANEMTSVDPLTGLLATHLFQDRAQAAVARYRRNGTNAVIMHVRIANLSRIREVHGVAVADQCMIRSAIKIGRLMADADDIGRVQDMDFGLIFESVTSRSEITERAARLIAHGLMPLQGLKPDVNLRFHIVAGALIDNNMESDELQAEIQRVLSEMSSRTRRPIRFLESGHTLPAPLDGPDGDEQETASAPGLVG